MPNGAVNSPHTDREWLIEINGNVGKLTESVDRFANLVEKLEERRLEPLEQKVQELERKQSERQGRDNAVQWVIGILTILSLVYTFLK